MYMVMDAGSRWYDSSIAHARQESFKFVLDNSSVWPLKTRPSLCFSAISVRLAFNMAAIQQDVRQDLCYVNDVSKETPFWTVVVQLVRKEDVKIGKSGKMYQGYVFSDMHGTFVGAVSYEETSKRLDKILHPYHRYYVSNAPLKSCTPGFNVSDYPYTWTLTNRIPVHPICDPVPCAIPHQFNFKRLSDIHKFIDHDGYFGIRALVIHSYPVADASKKTATEYVVVDEGKKLILLRAWGDMVDNKQNQVSSKLPTPTLLAVTNVKVTTHHGLSLSAKTNSCVLHNPLLGDANSLLDWYPKHAQELQLLLQEKTYANTDILFPMPSPNELVPVSAVYTTITECKTAWISATMHLIPDQGKMYYMCCKNCNRALTAREGWDFPCSSCSANAGYHPRSRIGVHLQDTTASLCASLFTPYADELIGYTATQIKEMTEQGIPFEANIAKAINGKQVVCFLKYIDRKYMGNTVRDYPIVKLYIQENHGLTKAAPHKETKRSDNDCLGLVPPEQGEKSAEQLFSPTTKRVLTEIANSSEAMCKLPNQLAVKKCLQFDEDIPLNAALTITAPAYQSRNEEKDMPPPGFPTVLPAQDTTAHPVKMEEKQQVKGPSSDASEAYNSPVKKLKTKEMLN